MARSFDDDAAGLSPLRSQAQTCCRRCKWRLLRRRHRTVAAAVRRSARGADTGRTALLIEIFSGAEDDPEEADDVLPEARVEFNAATDWYEQQRAGLGTKFVAQVREVLGRITTDPERHAMVYLDVRKVLVPKFPYVVLYRELPDGIEVVRVVHGMRRLDEPR